MIKHTSKTIGSNEGRKEWFLSDFGVIFVRFEEVFDVRESVGFGEAADGVLLGVARGERRGIVRGD